MELDQEDDQMMMTGNQMINSGLFSFDDDRKSA